MKCVRIDYVKKDGVVMPHMKTVLTPINISTYRKVRLVYSEDEHQYIVADGYRRFDGKQWVNDGVICTTGNHGVENYLDTLVHYNGYEYESDDYDMFSMSIEDKLLADIKKNME